MALQREMMKKKNTWDRKPTTQDIDFSGINLKYLSYKKDNQYKK